MTPCTLCPRQCGIDRSKNRSFCHAGSELLLSHTMLHHWEEPCLSGQNGAGAVFFGGCPLGCVYCQNRAIVEGKVGREVTPHELCEVFLQLEKQGAHCIDLVTPTHFWDRIAEAVKEAKARGIAIPFVANTGGFERSEILQEYAKDMDIFLTDYKYGSKETAQRYSSFADYEAYAFDALETMVSLVGEPRFGKDGLLKKGVIVRHLVLPAHETESMAVLTKLFERFGNGILYAIMNQYTPPQGIGGQFPELASPLHPIAYKRVVRHAERLGIENGYMQEGGTVSESFIPNFPTQRGQTT